MDPAAHHARAAEALNRGDPLAALNAVSGDESPHARAVRGIALAQLQELDAAQRELQAAAEELRDHPLYHARALAALAEVAAARREIGTALDALETAADRLQASGDLRNAAWSRLVRVRTLLLIGDIDQARVDLQRAGDHLPADAASLKTAFALARAASAVRELATDRAQDALDAARKEADSDNALLRAELEAHRTALTEPLAVLRVRGREAQLTLPELATVFRPGDNGVALLRDARSWLIIDAIAHRVGFRGDDLIDLGSRDVLFAILIQLANAWPGEAAATELIQQVFSGPPQEESYRERCKVEVGRLRQLLPPGVAIEACGHAWRLRVANDQVVASVRLLQEETALTVLLSDGQAWATRDLAVAIGSSQRSVQRGLRELAETGDVHGIGRARSQRWVADQAPLGIASQMFLVSLLDPR